MNQLFPDLKSQRPGFRLHKLEVYNWGTFDSTRGSVYTVRTNGDVSLLIGRNGSGKSTLVDAILTLLVRPGVRNYNVAAGAKKRERDERSYIKGAYDRRSRDADNQSDVQYLRPGTGHYSCLLASFHNEDTGKWFTTALIMYMNADGKAEKVYCFAPDERSIATDCAGLTRMDKLRQQMQQRGFKATASYAEYMGWFSRATGIRPKAMDMFNQTVAVKDIESLDTFIRDHMLESRPWSERVDSLLSHFTQLSQAHGSLARVRRQSELLTPISEHGTKYKELADGLKQTEELLDAADAFFRHKTIDLFVPACSNKRDQLAETNKRQQDLANQIADAQNDCRQLMNEIESASGERLRQIPLLIRAEQATAASRQQADTRLRKLLQTAEITVPNALTARSIKRLKKPLPTLSLEIDQQVAATERERDERTIKRGEVQRSMSMFETELKTLNKRKSNLAPAMVQMRTQLCRDLNLTEQDLPFAAELMAVSDDQVEWKPSIEKALYGLALNLLVPEQHYKAVSEYINKTRMTDARGRGQRLVYLKVGTPRQGQTKIGPTSLLNKLVFRADHPLLPWLRAELENRFNFDCCETIDAFRKSPGPAMTSKRHIKYRGGRHEKDDRDRASNVRSFVLGWNNGEKQKHLAVEIGKYRDAIAKLDKEIADADARLFGLRSRLAAIAELDQFEDFAAIDFTQNEQAIAALRLEELSIKSGDESVRVLEQRLGEAQSKVNALMASRDEAVGSAKLLQSEIEDGERLVQNAKTRLAEHATDYTHHFAAIDDCFADEPLTVDTVLLRESSFLDTRRRQLRDQTRKAEPVLGKLMKAMNRFLREFPDERADLDAAPEYTEGFCGLLNRIQAEDLPRHEQRFKERLNEKVTQEIGFLNGSLQSEATEIRSKIETLNKSLRQLEYRTGTFMRLEPRPSRDREIADFRTALTDCLSGDFEGKNGEEKRYQQIEQLITRLRDEDRWRKKVTDVRRWFNFAALEIDEATEQERSCYTDSAGQSGGEKAKLAFTILVAAIAYQYDIDPDADHSERFHFVVVDEMFSKVDDRYSEYALELFRKFGLQVLIVAPLDSKARVTEPYVGCYMHVVKNEKTNNSEIFSMTAREFEKAVL